MRFWEEIGSRFFSGFGGVLMVEAEKQIYAPLMQKIRKGGRRAYVQGSLAQPAGV
jgi:hypothetical protein